MNIAGLPDLVVSLFRGAPTSTAPPLQNAPKFQIGADYVGVVKDQLPNGRFGVDVAGQRMNMALPSEFKAGDSVRLTYVTNGVRPTFVLRMENNQPPPAVTISTSAQQMGALTRLASGAQPVVSERPLAASASSLLGGASGVLAGMGRTSGLLGEAVEAPRASLTSSGVLTSNANASPLAPGQNTLPAQLARSVSESGLFYESHLAQWSRGERSLEAIQREPQAKLAGQPVVADLGMPAKAAQLASQQLHLLDGQPFVWQGQAWPGQEVEWRVQERDAREGGEGDEEAPAWKTDLAMTLPHLGPVRAHLGLTGDQLSLGLSAPDQATLAAMRAALPDLVSALQAAGLEPVRVSITEASES